MSPVQAVLRLLGGDVTSPGPELIIFPWMLQMIVSFLREEKAVIQRMRTSLVGIVSILFLKRELLGVGWLNAWVSWCLFSQREAVSFFYWWMSGRMWDLPSEECSAKLCSWSWQKTIMLGGPWGLCGLFLLSTHWHYDCYGKGVKTNKKQPTRASQPFGSKQTYCMQSICGFSVAP